LYIFQTTTKCQVAGGIAYGTSVLETLIKESTEEASLPSELVRTHAIASGAVSYFHVREKSAGGEEGLLQPEVQYVYDLSVGEEVVLKPNDDEVEGFTLMPLHEVAALHPLSFNYCFLMAFSFLVLLSLVSLVSMRFPVFLLHLLGDCILDNNP
jgi:8-oxo-dGTP pyrophosphatase MutT (NUDIX family)